MLRAFLAPTPADRVVDLGCGSGRALVWNQDFGAYQVGVDVSPHFAQEARAGVDLVIGDLRRLPIADGAFTKAFSLDVAEHLSRESLVEMLREGRRVLAPGGALFLYTHVRKNSPLALGLRAINGSAKGFDRLGLIARAGAAPEVGSPQSARRHHGFQAGRGRRRVLASRASATTRRSSAASSRTSWCGSRKGRWPDAQPRVPLAPARRTRLARCGRPASRPSERIAQRGASYAALRALTWLMKLDILLFGRIESGPFFALLVRTNSRFRIPNRKFRRMRILYVAIDQVVPGTKGGSMHVAAVADGLAALGHEVHVLATAGSTGFPPGPVRWHALRPPLGVRQLRLLRPGRFVPSRRRSGPT